MLRAHSANFTHSVKHTFAHAYSPNGEQFKNPENADKLYSAGGSVNAESSFGGYVGDQPYGCDASVTTSGDIHAHAYSLKDILNPTATP